ncbi:NAD-dependent epimerase/dehydratase family protein [Candidatus Zixiibacteriota bacterium]
MPDAERVRRILITGGAGFIGSHIADAFIESGHEVGIIDNLSTGEKALLPPDAAFFEGDIRDEGFVRKVFAEFKPEVLDHHAAQMDVRKSVEDPRYDADVNITGSLTLLNACVEHGVQRVLFSSTGGAIYGEQSTFPADESHPADPISPYGVSKLALEKYLLAYRTIHGISFAVLRYANVYGPRQNPFGEAGVVAIFTHKLLDHEEPVINGDGLQTRDYVYIRDVVSANIAALDGPETIVANIGTGEEHTVVDIYQGVVRAVGWGGAEQHGSAKAGEQARSVIDPIRAWNTWGWRPQTPLDEGLNRTVRYFRNAAGETGGGGRIRGDRP